MLTLACGQIGKWYGPLYGEAIRGVDDIVQYILKPSVIHTSYCVSIFFNKNETSSCLIEPVVCDMYIIFNFQRYYKI